MGSGCDEPIAHVKQLPDGTWAKPQTLREHLAGTAARAARFARAFGSEAWGRGLGVAHDTGKAPDTWQDYLCRESGYDPGAHLEGGAGRVEHSAPGAKLALDVFGNATGRLLAYCIAGHHAGLPDWHPGDVSPRSALSYRLSAVSPAAIHQDLREELVAAAPGAPPWKFDSAGLDLSLWIRMLFSCLVDADFLDTEEYMDADKAATRAAYLTPDKLLARLNDHIDGVVKAAGNTRVNAIRRSVLEDCRGMSREQPGVFTLTVPTGGGKTLSSMAFALEHAVRHGLDRVIYVIPYTSIIEQNADVFKSALGPDQVIEHHSNIDPDDCTPQARLASENWDAPVVVTTTVQFFESLFAAKPGRCRKLHNVANSVIVLDEAQLLPSEFLLPILSALHLLVRRYRASIVISTATQPAFESRGDFSGFPRGSVREIISDVPALYRDLERVTVEVATDLQVPVSWEALAAELAREKQILCVVSERKSARELYGSLPEADHNFHLSALMCAQHRSDVVSRIRSRLSEDQPVRVVSTQLVEAGVDLDFPIVYRALAGLDSIAQAAGRCNREGRREDKGRVVVFRAPRKPPPGILRKAAQIAETMFLTGIENPLDHRNFETFFGQLYWQVNSLDTEGIMQLLTPDQQDCAMQFRTAAERFRIIQDAGQRAVIVPYGKGAQLIELLRKKGPDRWLLRKLQRYTVNVYTNDFAAMTARGAILEAVPGVFVLATPLDYDDKIGLKTDQHPYDPNALVL